MAQKREARRNSARPAGARGAPGELHERLPPGRRREEVSFSESGGGEAIYLHISVSATDTALLNELIRQAEKITLEKTEAAK